MSTSQWIAILSGLSMLPGNTVAQSTPTCDPGLRSPAENTYAYAPRGDRCEGVYVKQVGGTVLSVASLTSAFEKFDPATVESLHVTWTAQADSGLRIRVRGITPNLYYGMDAVRPAESAGYEWPASILSSLRITQRDIGALAWTRRLIDGSPRTVYVPVKITAARDSASAHGYQLVLFPGVKLKEVYVTLGSAGDDGKPVRDSLLKDREAQNQGYYPAERPIRIALPALEPRGLYYLEVSAELPNGSPVAVEPMLIDASMKGRASRGAMRSATP